MVSQRFAQEHNLRTENGPVLESRVMDGRAYHTQAWTTVTVKLGEYEFVAQLPVFSFGADTDWDIVIGMDIHEQHQFDLSCGSRMAWARGAYLISPGRQEVTQENKGNSTAAGAAGREERQGSQTQSRGGNPELVETSGRTERTGSQAERSGQGLHTQSSGGNPGQLAEASGRKERTGSHRQSGASRARAPRTREVKRRTADGRRCSVTRTTRRGQVQPEGRTGARTRVRPGAVREREVEGSRWSPARPRRSRRRRP